MVGVKEPEPQTPLMLNILTLNSREELFQIKSLEFVTEDVLKTPNERMRRRAQLLQAVALESIGQSEVILHLESLPNQKKIKSRIVATGDDRVVLDKGLMIPIHCIFKVEFP